MKAFRKVIPALALMLVSATILSTASYAWFTMSRQVTAKGLDVTVTAPNNLLIDNKSAGAWDDSWTESETVTVTGVSLIPASTINGTAFFTLKDNTPAVSSTGALIDDKSVLEANTNAATTTAAGAYYDFEYRIKTEGADAVKVALTALTVANTAEAGKTKNSIKPVRVAILTGATETPSTVAALYNMNAGANQEDGKAVKKAKATTDTAASVRDTVTYKTGTDITKFSELTSSSPETFTVPANGMTYVTIRVWYEGEDTECTIEKAVEAKFSVTAEFSAIPKATT